MRSLFFLGLLLSIALLGGCAQPAAQACFDGKCLSVEVVREPAALQRGLMHRENLPPDAGMLFVFPEKGSHGIWMKNMRFPIDILWLDEAGNIVWIEENVFPCPQEPCPVYYPESDASFVLEVNASYITKNDWVAGKKVSLPV